MAIIILTISAYLVLAAHLPMSAFSQLPFLPDSHTSTNSNLRTTQSNNKISSSETANSSSLNKITNTSKLKLPTLQIKGIEVTATNLSYKGVDKFGIKEIYPTKKGGGREWYINMADPRND